MCSHKHKAPATIPALPMAAGCAAHLLPRHGGHGSRQAVRQLQVRQLQGQRGCTWKRVNRAASLAMMRCSRTAARRLPLWAVPPNSAAQRADSTCQCRPDIPLKQARHPLLCPPAASSPGPLQSKSGCSSSRRCAASAAPPGVRGGTAPPAAAAAQRCGGGAAGSTATLRRVRRGGRAGKVGWG